MSVTLHLGDCRDVLRSMPDASIDAVVTDPPYGLGKAPDALAMLRDWLDTGHHDVKGRGFMGREWDAFVPQPALWREIARVMKPGAHLLAFAGTRTMDVMGLALRLAGLEIRDCLSWNYGSGFSKSWNFKTLFAGEWCTCATSGNPVPYEHEHDMHSLREGLLRDSKPSSTSQGADVLQAMQRREQGSGLGNTRTQGLGRARPSEGSGDGRAPERGEQPVLEGRELHRAWERVSTDTRPNSPTGEDKRLRFGAHRSGREDARASSDAVGGSAPHQSPEGGQPTGEPARLRESPGALDDGALRDGGCCTRCGKLSQHYQGVGTALKPAWEPIVLARKPLIGTVAANVQAHGTGGLNIDACRIGTAGGAAKGSFPNGPSVTAYGNGLNGACDIVDIGKGRWPANVCLDEVAAAMLDEQSGDKGGGFGRRGSSARPKDGYAGSDCNAQATLSRLNLTGEVIGYGDSGGASRFFYTSKAGKDDRELEDGSRSTHPTVKPTDLMQWLVRLVTPPGGVVLDPFMGSGSTGVACMNERLRFVGIEREPEYHAIAVKRLEAATRQGLLDL